MSKTILEEQGKLIRKGAKRQGCECNHKAMAHCRRSVKKNNTFFGRCKVEDCPCQEFVRKEVKQ